jgi:Concanavalin A-like lectin/glucanases superfamily
MFRTVGVAAALAAFAITGSSAAANSGLVGQWHFDEGSGLAAHDSSGNNNTGTLVAAPGFAVPGWIPGRFGTALSFNGDDGVQIAQSSVLEPQPQVSVSAWVKSVGSPGAYRYIVGKGANGCDSSSYALYTGANGGLSFYISNGHASATADYGLSPQATGGVWDGTWHLVVGTYDGSILRLYVDGVEVGSGTPFSGPIDYTRARSTDLFIGDYPPQPPPCEAGGFSGAIDEVNAWSFAVSPDVVNSLYQPPPPGGSSPPTSAPPTPTGPSPTGTGTGNGTNHGSPPALSHLRVLPATLAITAKGQHGKGKASRKMTISYTDTKAAVSSFSVLQPQSGVVRRGRCVAPPKGKLGKQTQRCTRYRVLGKFARADRAGTNQFAFTAVPVLQLAPHSYLLDATPSLHGLTGRTVSTGFAIKR